MMFVLLFLTQLFYYLPKPVLGAIVLVAVSGLLEFDEMKHLWKLSKEDFFVSIACFTLTLIIGVENGLLVSVGLSVLLALRRTVLPHYAVLGRLPDSDAFMNVKRYPEAAELPGIVILRFDSDILFFNCNTFRDMILAHSQDGERIKAVILELSGVNNMDSTALLALSEIAEAMRKQKRVLLISRMKGPMRDLLRSAEVEKSIGLDRFFVSTIEATEYASEAIRPKPNDDGHHETIELVQQV